MTPLAPKERDRLAVADYTCPMCTVPPGEPCWMYAADTGTQPRSRPHPERAGLVPYGLPLSAREFEVAALVERGLTDAQIGRILCVSLRTVNHHMEHIRAKLGVRSRDAAGEAVRGALLRERLRAVLDGLGEPEPEIAAAFGIVLGVLERARENGSRIANQEDTARGAAREHG
jgi:DNA-binding CsgD family transcriptional regulator